MASIREPALGLKVGEAEPLSPADASPAGDMPARTRLLIRQVENSISTLQVDIHQLAAAQAKLVLAAELACLSTLATALARALDQAETAFGGDLTVRLGR